MSSQYQSHLILNTPYTELDGRINIDLDSKIARRLANFVSEPPAYTPPEEPSKLHISRKSWTIRLNIVVQVVGSRGDVQPFVALGQELQSYGHRVRIATHDCFASFVGSSNIEFFPIGGDPHDLMAYMVTNPGLIPSMSSVRAGDVWRKRAMVEQMLHGCWKSCIEPAPGDERPFVADAIIANPHSFAHVHCAQALGVQLHLMFTMPWSNTRHFPHPLANLSGAGLDIGAMNYVSYTIVDLGDVVNPFRSSIDLERINTTVGPNLAGMLQIPFTYCWPPALVPKPAGWPSHIDVCGFFFRESPQYSPPDDMWKFLQTGIKPIYIGFGSIVLEDPAVMTRLILDAVCMSGTRAIISRGWSKLGSDLKPAELDAQNILFIDDCPHEWLFQQSFQPFGGSMVASAGAGAHPMHDKIPTAEKLRDAIRFCLQPTVMSSVQKIADVMSAEHGVRSAAESFNANLPLESLSCEFFDDRPATYLYSSCGLKVRLCTVAAHMLVQGGRIKSRDLKLYQSKSFNITNERWDPLTGLSSSGLSVIRGMVTATGAMTTARAVTNFGKSFGKFNERIFQGAIVDMPLAVAEGLRSVPKLYGEDVPSHGDVTDAASGFIVGLENLCRGMKEEGAWGFTKGTGKGLVGLAAKTTSAAIGIVAYPGQGTTKCLIAPFKSTTRKSIMSQRAAEGEHMVRTQGLNHLDVLQKFDALMLYGRTGASANTTSPYMVYT
ncbi:glycosyltransferase family 1 protein [Karstenula rhodostoma CBS 690.94]|uniref:Glycosyltransferase family 1 protein n=1 Tax=Karstenula rhodostoma CBS 690.94 TaxID=1392251 RepID=A0A9P4U8N6_9PLEO|nr:glycosyltransferase family 1 protein [Karstenula rhodostoma CBS 690.94]